MSENERGESKGFKVVDRRRFDETGDVRDGAEVLESARRTPAPKSAPPPPAAAKAAPTQEPPRTATNRDVTTDPHFMAFLQSLAQQAVMHLGLMPYPSGHRDLQLDAARDTIDMIAMLQRKTKGNLSSEEDTLLDGILGELKMTYVEVAQQVSSMSEGGGPGGMPGGMPGGGFPPKL